MPRTAENRYCTTREAAQLLGVSLRTAQLWSENGLLDAWKTEGGHRRISRESIFRLQTRNQDSRPDPSAKLEKLKVLIVEDDNILLRLYKVRITSWGLPIEVITSSNAYDALVLIGRESPDLMITDLMMEGINGLQMIKTLIHSPFKEGMEIIIVSGLSAEEIEAMGKIPPGIPVYPKPAPFDALKAHCRQLLERRKAAMERS